MSENDPKSLYFKVDQSIESIRRHQRFQNIAAEVRDRNHGRGRKAKAERALGRIFQQDAKLALGHFRRLVPDCITWGRAANVDVSGLDKFFAEDDPLSVRRAVDALERIKRELAAVILGKKTNPAIATERATPGNAEAPSENEEWSTPLSKTEMASRMELGIRAFETWSKQQNIKKLSRSQWRIRLDTMDKHTRRKIEGR